MKLAELDFARPEALQATAPPEARGLARDEVRLLASSESGHVHARFLDLATFLNAGDLLVVNDSATLPASLPAVGSVGPFILNLATDYGKNLWLAEPRWSPSEPGPLPLEAGERLQVAGLEATLLSPYPGLPRLRFVRLDGDVTAAMYAYGEPIRYGYLARSHPLEAYQTIFARVPGSAEMPSAARPFSGRVLKSLEEKGIDIKTITLHTGVSSLELTDGAKEHVLYPEPFAVPAETAAAVNAARQDGRRVIAVGTTVVRALESAWDGSGLVARRGFTRLYLHPGRGVRVVNGILTGFHDPKASHLAMLHAIAGKDLVQEGYGEAVREGYLWHEFGDVHLLAAPE
jgi:S-adenosylmethionine:tRNA ribosyltransferase-isomerase